MTRFGRIALIAIGMIVAGTGIKATGISDAPWYPELIAFIVGLAGGAWAHYWADRYDKRRDRARHDMHLAGIRAGDTERDAECD